MTNKEYAALLRAYHAAKLAADKAKVLGEQIKAAMAADGLERVEAGGYAATAKVVTSTTVDTKAMEKDHPELVAQYKRKNTAVRLYLK